MRLKVYLLVGIAAAVAAYLLGLSPVWSLAIGAPAPAVLAAAAQFLRGILVGRPVGTAAIQEVVAGAPMQDCSKTMVVTNHEFTPAARKLAELHGCELVGRSELPRLRSTIRRLAELSEPGRC